ncbi:hypothetical protein BJX96DRAFT_155969 [Aspergillus floccosus]
MELTVAKTAKSASTCLSTSTSIRYVTPSVTPTIYNMDEMSTQDPTVGMILGPDMPLLSWDEVYRKAMLSPQARPSLSYDANPLANSNIDTILSASSYPFPEPSDLDSQYESTSRQLYGGLLVNREKRDSDRSVHVVEDATSEAHSQALIKADKSSQRLSPTKKESSKKRGRPRKTAEGSTTETPDERRRMQIRLAQRAYRSRKEANITSLKSRVATLETAVERMSSAVLSFSEELVQSGVLASHPGLTGSLRDTVQTCLSLAKEATHDNPQEDAETSPQSEESIPSDTYSTQASNSQPINHIKNTPAAESFSLLGSAFRTQPPKMSEATFTPLDIAEIEVSAFMERLHFACLYQGLLALSDPSIPTSRLEAPFRLLLSMMDRKRIRAYFEAALRAKVGQRRLEEWTDIPFFRVGGAGTHYARWSPFPESPLDPYQGWTLVQDPLARLSPSLKEDLDGDWFDIRDLEGYLREKRVRLRSSPPPKWETSAQGVVNVVRLLPALISKAVCLGRTPGFRRLDVDQALLLASC